MIEAVGPSEGAGEGSGEGEGSASGEGSAVGSGDGSGEGSGDGEGSEVGSGDGSGEGSGDGEGSGVGSVSSRGDDISLVDARLARAAGGPMVEPKRETTNTSATRIEATRALAVRRRGRSLAVLNVSSFGSDDSIRSRVTSVLSDEPPDVSIRDLGRNERAGSGRE
jgi:hypothetical protein